MPGCKADFAVVRLLRRPGARMITQFEQGSKAVLRSKGWSSRCCPMAAILPSQSLLIEGFYSQVVCRTCTSDDSPLLLGCSWGLLLIRGGLGLVGLCGTWVITR